MNAIPLATMPMRPLAPGRSDGWRETAIRGLRDLADRLRGDGFRGGMPGFHAYGYGVADRPLTAWSVVEEARRHVAVFHPEGSEAARAAIDGLGIHSGYGSWGHHGPPDLDRGERERIAGAIDRLLRSLDDPARSGWQDELRGAVRLGSGRLCLMGLRQEVVRIADGVGPVPGFPGRGVRAALDALRAATHATPRDVEALSWIDSVETADPARLTAAIDALQAIQGRVSTRSGTSAGPGLGGSGWPGPGYP